MRDSFVRWCGATLVAVGLLACSKADMPGEKGAKPAEPAKPEVKAAEKPAEAPKAAAWQAGAALPDAAKVTVAAVLAAPDQHKDKPVRVEGTVAAVCQHRGCWVELRDGEDKLIVKSLAHDIAFPKDGTGQRMVVEGIVRVDAPESCEHKAGGEGGAGHDSHAHAGEHHGEGEAAHECPKPKTLVEVRRAELLPQG
jgi:hypothetical protein